ncbi:MAG TPA: CpsD/CapB family tyrosine-protein kinase [Polyangia bacterium]|jgi:Mrp family chromosome partitioning ATPase|nr:CpsD/CapB family tyrosine-protein kinase [Polyangia bacterium]
MATRPWPPRVIRQDGTVAPALATTPGETEPTSDDEALSGPTSSMSPPTMVGTAAARPEDNRQTGAQPQPTLSTRPSRVAEVTRESGTRSTTSLQVRQARGVLQPVRDRAHQGRGPDGETPLGESRALAVADKQGEIFFVKHTMTADAPDARLAMLRDRDSHRAASYRLLRQRLVEHGDPKVILVTSARNREGKTTSATNLALAYAEQGHSRVLLIEANFRSAALGELFGFKPPRCLSVQLDRHRDRPMDPWVVVQVAPIDVHVVAVHPNCCPSCSRVLVSGASFCGDCGRKVSNDAIRLDRVTFAASIQRFRKAFDYIIIDGPSVLESADVNLIQDTADGIVMAVRGKHSDARSLKRAMDQVSPAPVLGVALVED